MNRQDYSRTFLQSNTYIKELYQIKSIIFNLQFFIQTKSQSLLLIPMSSNIFTQQDSFNLLGFQHGSLSNIFDFNNEENMHIDYNQCLPNQQIALRNTSRPDYFKMIDDSEILEDMHLEYEQNNEDRQYAGQMGMSFEHPIFASTLLNRKKSKDCKMDQIEQERSSEFSSQNTQSVFSVQNCISILENNICLRTAPVDQINAFLKNSIDCPQQSKEKCLKKAMNLALKKKMILKREKAKGRKQYATIIKQQYLEEPQIFQSKQEHNLNAKKGKRSTYVVIDEEKRKRNRISAQVSRDRRRNYTQELQISNAKLKQDFADMQKENIRLKKQLQTLKEKRINEAQNDSQRTIGTTFVKAMTPPVKNKMNKLLILLGIIFLIGSLKSLMTPPKNILPQLKEISSFSNKRENLVEFPQAEKQGLIQEASLLLSQEFERLSITPYREELQKKILGRKSREVKVQPSQLSIFQAEKPYNSKSRSLPNRAFSFISNIFFTMLPNLKSAIFIPKSLQQQISAMKRGTLGLQN